jgi:hypothetical protein
VIRILYLITALIKCICAVCVHEFFSVNIQHCQAVSRWVRSQVRSCEICGGHSGAGAGFLRTLRFHLPSLIPAAPLRTCSPIIRGWCSRPVSGRRTKWTVSPHPKNSTFRFI